MVTKSATLTPSELQLKIKELDEKIAAFEQKYGMTYADFEQACMDGRIEDPYSYEVEKDDCEWEAFVTDRRYFEKLRDKK